MSRSSQTTHHGAIALDGAAVLFAGLYWGGDSNNAARNQVKFETPASGGYLDLSGVVIGSANNDYQAFENVTSLVQAAGNGTYTVANVQADTGNDRQAGWGMVVVYRAPGLSARNLTVFDGFVDQGSSDPPTTVSISGFQAPPSGPVNATIGVIAYEGDLALSGDSMQLNGTSLSDAVNGSSNFFNSSISSLGAHFTNKNPNYVNQLGFDIAAVATTNLIGNNDTSATVTVTTNQDAYFPGVITTAIDLFSPTIQPVKAYTDLNGGDVRPGDVIEYTITLPNTGQDAATNMVFRDAIPANATYVPGSLEIVSGANTGPKSDGVGDDQAEFDAVGNQVVFRLGAGADATSGGVLAIGDTTTVRFQVTINPTAPNGTVVTNQGSAQFTGQSTGFPLSADSNPVSVTVAAQADLALTKTVSDATPNVGDTIRFTLNLSNLGPDSATGVFVRDQLPSNLTFVSATASQGTINVSTATWDVGTLASGQSEQVFIEAIVNSLTPQVNIATVTSETPDLNPRNNIAAAVEVPQAADLRLVKSVSDATPNVGDIITITLTLTNNGPNAATDAQVSDTVPPGLTFQGATPSQGSYDPFSGIWSVGTLANGATATLTVTATVNSVRPQRNAATASANQFDPDPGNNSDGAIVVPQLADLAVLKTVDNAAPNIGDIITFTISVANKGPNTATNVMLQDSLPDGLAFQGATPSQGSFDEISGVWSVGSLANGATATLSIQAMVTSANPATNVVTVSGADQFDPNTANTDEAPLLVNLALVKAVSNPTPNIGEVVTYTLTVTNNGPDTAANVLVADPLPAGMVFLSATPSQGSYDDTSGIWSVGSLANGVSETLMITVRVNDAAPMQNVAVTSANQFDPDPSDNSSTVIVTPQIIDLQVVKTVSNATPNVGEIVTFTVQVTNNGPGDATGVAVRDLAPPGFSLVSQSTSQGIFDPGTGEWTVGNLADGATATLTVRAMVFRFRPAINFATVRADQFDPVRRNNLSLALINPQAADLSVSKIVDNPAPNVGDTITFTITLTNVGPDAATNILVSDPLPAGLTFVSATPSQGFYDASTGLWTVGTLAASDSQTLTIVALVDSATTTTNIVTVTLADQYDPDPSNNSDGSTVTPQQFPTSVVSFERFGFHHQPTLLVLGFSDPLDQASAEDLSNYTLTLVAFAGRLRRTLPLTGATYDPATNSVTLMPRIRFLPIRFQYELIINASSPTGVRDTLGRLIDGDGDGRLGGNYVRTFGREILTGPNRSTFVRRLPLAQSQSGNNSPQRPLLWSQLQAFHRSSTESGRLIPILKTVRDVRSS